MPGKKHALLNVFSNTLSYCTYNCATSHPCNSPTELFSLLGKDGAQHPRVNKNEPRRMNFAYRLTKKVRAPRQARNRREQENLARASGRELCAQRNKLGFLNTLFRIKKTQHTLAWIVHR